ncbi:hypothetical protein DFH09DRAFT_1078300 [Mycena vulgaris]|nr:hypothetical protein DFH09DRAFT_1078300 [Mycena vulgaris]
MGLIFPSSSSLHLRCLSAASTLTGPKSAAVFREKSWSSAALRSVHCVWPPNPLQSSVKSPVPDRWVTVATQSMWSDDDPPPYSAIDDLEAATDPPSRTSFDTAHTSLPLASNAGIPEAWPACDRPEVAAAISCVAEDYRNGSLPLATSLAAEDAALATLGPEQKRTSPGLQRRPAIHYVRAAGSSAGGQKGGGHTTAEVFRPRRLQPRPASFAIVEDGRGLVQELDAPLRIRAMRRLNEFGRRIRQFFKV